MDWITGIQNAIDYMEAHITEELDYEEIAKQSFSSSFHFQRVFSILCGYTLGEYIRCRRLSLAGTELASGKGKVIDVAYKYGYDTPESFSRAFQKFHGVTPSQARGSGVQLKSFSRLSIKVSLEGGNVMNYRIEEKPAMLLTGYKRRFCGNPNDRKAQDHYFACETRALQYMLEGMSREFVDIYEVMTNFSPDGYDFFFAKQLPQIVLRDFDEDLGEMAKEFEHLQIPLRSGRRTAPQSGIGMASHIRIRAAGSPRNWRDPLVLGRRQRTAEQLPLLRIVASHCEKGRQGARAA